MRGVSCWKGFRRSHGRAVRRATMIANEKGKKLKKDSRESQKACGEEEEAEEGASPPREIPRLYPSLTRLANLTIEDELPPWYRPFALPKSSPVKKSPFLPQQCETAEEWEEGEEGMLKEEERARTKSKQRGAVYKKPAWEQYQEPGHVFPVLQDQQGNRGWAPLDHKLLKELQQSVQLYGPHANFMQAVLENIGQQGLIPDDWRNLAKAVLGGGDFLLWSAAYRALAREQSKQNHRAGNQAWNEEMLNGEGRFTNPDDQAQLPIAVLLQVREIARRAWRVVPRKGEIRHSLTKIVQGSTEPYADFMNRLMGAAGNIFETVEEAMPLVRKLAYEQANKTCHEALRPWQHKDIPTFLKICKDVMDDVASGSHAAVAMAQQLRWDMGGRKYFKCGKEGHLKRECRSKFPARNQQGMEDLRRPGLCPRCGKGNHWAKECYSKMDRAGNP
uniref:CCHC-type domain-containing protein n=1 Tax=Oryctolagus cuniculus TaxID=9986 RepID=A0A5F9CCV7_RABIT